MGAALTDAAVGLDAGALSDADVGLSPGSGGALSDADVGLAPEPSPRLVSKAGFKQAFSDLTSLPALTAGAYETVTGGLGWMAGGVAGAAAAVENAVSRLFGRTPQREPVAMMRQIQEGMTYRGSPAAERVAGTVAAPFEAVHKGARAVGEAAEASGQAQMEENRLAWRARMANSPAMLAGLETLIEVPAYIYGPKVAGKAVEATVRPSYKRPEPLEIPFQPEPEAVPPSTGTSSGVPLPLDKLIAEAQYLGRGEIPQPPKPRQLVRETAKQGLEARKPPLLEADFVPGGAETRPRPGPELPEPPAPQAPAARAPAQPRDFFLEESPYKMDVPDSEVRGGAAYSGGEGRRVYQTLHFTDPFEVVLAGAGRELARAEMKGETPNPTPLRELSNALAQLKPDSPFLDLQGATYDRLTIAASQYWKQLREDMLQARKANPTGVRIQTEASPAESMTIYGEEPPPPRGLPPLPPPLTPAGELGLPPTRAGAGTYVGTAERKPSERAPAKERPATFKGGSLLYEIKQMGGIKPSEALDIGGERGFRASEGAGRGLFKKDGLGLDDLAQQLADKGYNLDPADVQGLRNMIRDELEGKQKHYRGQDEEAAFRAEAAKRGRGPGEFSANPMFDPEQIKASVKFFSEVGAKVTEQNRKWINAVQAVQESAKPALASVWKYANEVAAARERAQQDRIVKKVTPEFLNAVTKEFQDAINEVRRANPKYQFDQPKTVLEAIAATERARRETAKWRMQRELYEGGFAVKSTEGEAWKEFKQPSLNIRDLQGPDGRLLKIRNDALSVVEQMTGAHDIARQRRYQNSLLGAAEGISHGVVSWLMWNPFFHGITTGGKGLIYTLPGRERGSIFDFGKQAVETLSSREGLRDMMLHGARFFPKRASMQPMGAERGRVEAGMKQIGLDRPYEFYQWVHGNLLANIVNTVQTAFYHMRLEQQVRQARARGETVDAAKMDVFKSAAAEESNLIGGNLPREQLQEGVYRALGANLFSRGLTTSTVRMLTRAFENNRIIEAYARSKGFTPEEARQIMTRNRNFMAASLLMDYMALQITANAVNWVTTELNDEPGGKKGGHFVWENQGSDKSQTWLPTNVFVYPETKDGEPSGRGVYASSPMRVARDIVEWVQGIYEVATGQPPRILKNKLGPIPETLLETIQGSDWAGRPLSGPLDVAANVAGKVAPQPFGDVPSAAAESVRSGNFGFTVEAIKKSFDPDTAIPILLGAQPRIAANDPTTIKFAVEQSKEERRLWGRVARVKAMMRGMDQEVRQQEIQSVLEEARKIGMTPDKISMIARVMQTELPSKAQRRAATTYQRLHNEGEIPEPPQ